MKASRNYLRNVKYSYLFIIAIAVFFSACREVVDTELPTIDIDLPQEDDVVPTQDGLRVVATLTDDSGLLQYKVSLRGVDALNDIGADSTISFIIVDGIPENEKTLYVDDLFVLGDTTFNGHYRLIMACIDVEGNESVRDTVNFTIRNSIDSEPPQFNVSGPTPGDTLTIGQGFNTGGTVTDSQSLIYSEFFVGKADFSDTIRFVTFPWVQNNIVDYDNDFSWWFPVDSSWAEGQYHVYYTAWDNYSGVSHSIPFHISY